MNITQLKRQLNIEVDYVSDDIILQNYLDVAQEAVVKTLNLYTGSTSGYTGSTTPVSIQQAILLLAAHLYVTRQIISFGQPYSIPRTFDFLLNPYRDFTIT
jgi:hypothetical protein